MMTYLCDFFQNIFIEGNYCWIIFRMVFSNKTISKPNESSSSALLKVQESDSFLSLRLREGCTKTHPSTS